jgi:diaminohydroxyphosphoribosylaminopyrimidine deaminase/5-amino-6-(5-phosphoribosylamino)uracil reductase
MGTPDREIDLQMMRLAISEARRARPSPNPPVGAVIAAEGGRVVATGYHRQAGHEHAEVAALAAAGEAARGTTLYTSLEPCNHEGATTPCVDAVLRAGIKRVVCGTLDPNPHVTGGGAQRLKDAGLAVDVGVGAAEARELIRPWSKFITTAMPYVALKLALSLDGRIATRAGVSKWVTGPEARRKVQELRSLHDAVAIGIGTALSDDPRLTVRDEALLSAAPSPVRVVFDTKLRLPASSRLVQTSGEVPTWVVAGGDAPEDGERVLTDAGCSVLRAPVTADGRIDVAAALARLAEAGIVSMLVEGGAELAGSLLAARMADELHAFIAPSLLGPRGRPGAVDWAGPETPSDAPRIEDPAWEVCGQDAYVHGRLSFTDR